jgi:hypothetical protein
MWTPRCGLHIAPRRVYAEAADWGFVDVFGKLHPERAQYYVLGLFP